MQKVYPCLWFDHEAEEAARFYTSVFNNSRLINMSYYAENMPLPAGTVLTVTFELDGQRFMALNGGPMFKLSEAVSLVVPCDTQAEMDELYHKLSADPDSEQCGWIKDKYGVSWQIVPAQLETMLTDKDPKAAGRVMQAIMPMKRLNLARLEEAYRGDAEPGARA